VAFSGSGGFRGTQDVFSFIHSNRAKPTKIMADINDLLVRQENLLGPDIYKRTLDTSPWLKLVKKEKWPNGLSDTIRVLTFERSLAADVSTWTPLAVNDGSGNTCVPNASVISPAQSVRTYNLETKALESDKICVNDVRNSFQFQEQLRIMRDQLTENVAYVWKERFRNEYVRLSEHKVVATAGLPEGTASFPATTATTKLTNAILRRIYSNLLTDGAGRDGSVGMANGAPQFVLITSPETSEDLIFESGVREDFRDANPSELLKPLGVTRSYKGFYHITDYMPPRYNFVGGAWVRVEPYVGSAANVRGTKQSINPAYLSATHEDSIIFVMNVFHSMVPDSITSPGGDVKFDPQQYMGEFKWRNILDRVENPDGNWGYFRSVMQTGSKPVRPEFGYVIRHLRCPNDIGEIACTTSAVISSSV